MRVLVQRVSKASVHIREDGRRRLAGEIDRGFLILVAFHTDDVSHAEDTLPWMADKVVGLRLFPDHEDKMNRALPEVGGALLVVSQFTLYGDATKGRRPSFVAAARPEDAVVLYRRFLELLAARGVPVASGEFGAMMDVELVNDGPVTLWIER
jgi:D-tyrosyl-tRNA(Tyr) deacylase